MKTTTHAPVLITGATSGLGRRCAFELARRGRPVLVGGRRADAVDATCAAIVADGGAAAPFVADLSRLESVRAAMRTLGEAPLHGIVANAGVSTLRDQRSGDGFELTFAVNVLAHQLLLVGLADQLETGGRVVVVSSGVHDPNNRLARRAGIPTPNWVGTRYLARPDEAPASKRIEDGKMRYATSKLGNVLQARGLSARLRSAGRSVDVFAVDPGLMVDTRLARELPRLAVAVFRLVGRMATPFVDNMRLSPVSARHIASLIEDGAWRGRGFAYLDGDRVQPPSPDALRDDLVDALWTEANRLVGLRPADTSLPIV
ncbi:MAG: SDR family NAD(P)-dependent oxidoreductase [Myxococcota bacterium]